MLIPSSPVTACPRFESLARPVSRSTMPSVPPFLEMMPTMPPIISENRMMATWSALDIAFNTYTWKLSRRPLNTPHGEKPMAMTAPTHTPKNRAGTTRRYRSAMPIARSGGRIDSHPGMALVCADRRTVSLRTTSTVAAPLDATVTPSAVHCCAAGSYESGVVVPSTRTAGVSCAANDESPGTVTENSMPVSTGSGSSIPVPSWATATEPRHSSPAANKRTRGSEVGRVIGQRRPLIRIAFQRCGPPRRPGPDG